MSDIIVDHLQRLVANLMRRRHIHHVALGATTLDGSWTWADSAGNANPDGTPMRPDTPWLIASVTKLHIASITLRLHERGHLDLQAPVSAYVPAELQAGLHVLDGVDRTNELTVTHLLGHLSGLPDYLEERPPKAPSLIEEIIEGGDRSWTPADAVRRARDRLSPHFPPSDPGSRRPRIRYSDTNYQLLAVIAQHVTGRPIGELYREELFEPLGLADTWLPDGAPGGPRRPATVWMGRRPFDDRPKAMASFGDLYSTTEDLLRFGRALFSGAVFDRPDTADVLTRRFNRFGIPRSYSAIRSPSWPIEYGLGVMRFRIGRVLAGGARVPTLVGHTGSTGSWLWYLPQRRLLAAGTVDQTTAAAVPFRSVARAFARIRP